nr:RNA-directed DNA polymerase, eukaryota, reverse transcriptase zinc-binding domain protein [Tanacetum cinerariifolium]
MAARKIFNDCMMEDFQDESNNLEDENMAASKEFTVYTQQGFYAVTNFQDEEAGSINDDEEYKERMCKFHGMTYKKLPPITIEKFEITSYTVALAGNNKKESNVTSSYCLRRRDKELFTIFNRTIYGAVNVIGDLVNEVQSAFVAERQILDGPFILNEARSLKGTSINVMDLIRLKLGNGDSSSFWEDTWYAGGVIKELFPRLYALELHKHATVR